MSYLFCSVSSKDESVGRSDHLLSLNDYHQVFLYVISHPSGELIPQVPESVNLCDLRSVRFSHCARKVRLPSSRPELRTRP